MTEAKKIRDEELEKITGGVLVPLPGDHAGSGNHFCRSESHEGSREHTLDEVDGGTDPPQSQHLE